jgi:nucleoside-diphosphate-sugar epimerase
MNIGNPQEMSILELAHLIRALSDSSSRIEFVLRPEDDPTVRRPDIALARDELDWEPKVDIEDGLQRTIASFREHAELSTWLARRPDDFVNVDLA